MKGELKMAKLKKNRRMGKKITRRDFIKQTAMATTAAATVGTIGFPNVLRGATPPDVLIGHIHPLSGFLGYLGNQLKNGCVMAVDEINAAGGIKSLDGAKIKLLDADSEGKPDLSIPAVERLDREGVAAITGCLQSSVTIVATQVAEKQKVPFVVSVAVADKVTARGFKYTFRVQPNAAQMGAQTVQYISEIAKKNSTGIKSIAYIHDNTAFGSSLFAHVRDNAPKHGMDIAAAVPYSPKAADVSSEVGKVRAAKADLVMSTGYFADQVRVFRTMKGMRVQPKAFLGCGNGAFSDQNFVKELGDMTAYVMDGNYQANPTSPLAKKMFDHYQSLHDTKMAPSAIFAYEAIYVISDAIERARSTDREAVREALSQTDIKDHVLPQGPIVFGPDGQNKNAQAAVTQILDGKIKVVWPSEYAEADVVFPVPA
jgi:branched-chain amino acid transport system substrate-binding protein